MTDPELARPPVGDDLASRPNFLAASRQFDPAQPHTKIWMVSGEVVRVPTFVVLQSSDKWRGAAAQAAALSPNYGIRTTIPLVEERLEVGKRTVVT